MQLLSSYQLPASNQSVLKKQITKHFDLVAQMLISYPVGSSESLCPCFPLAKIAPWKKKALASHIDSKHFCVLQPEVMHLIQHLATSNKITLGVVLAFTVSNWDMLQAIALHNFQLLDMLSSMEWDHKLVLLLLLLLQL